MNDVSEQIEPGFTAAQMDQALAALDVRRDDFAFYFGVNRRTVQRWFHGELPIAPWVPVALALMTLPGGVAMATRVAQKLRLGEE